MTLEEIMVGACAQTGIDMTVQPVRGDKDRYLTWHESFGALERYASNGAMRIRSLVTVDLFTRVHPHSGELTAILAALKRGGVTPLNWGPEDYEQDTQWYHMPISCRVIRTTETEE